MKKKLFGCEIKENIFLFFNMVLMTSLTIEIAFLFIAIVSPNAQMIFSDEYLKTYEIISLNNTDELEHAVEIIGADNIEGINIGALIDGYSVQLVFDNSGDYFASDVIEEGRCEIILSRRFLKEKQYSIGDSMLLADKEYRIIGFANEGNGIIIPYNSIEDKNEIVVGSLVVQTKKKLSSTQRKQLEQFDDDLTNVQLYNKYNIREKLIVVALYAAMFSVIIGLCVRNMVGIYKIYEHSNAEKYSIYINNGADAGFITRLKAFYLLFSFLCSAVIIVLINVILRLV